MGSKAFAATQMRFVHAAPRSETRRRPVVGMLLTLEPTEMAVVVEMRLD
jgi:hypothetical protein